MLNTIPGTDIPATEQTYDDIFSMFKPILDATGGLTLSQLTVLTGIEGTTIQNWIKRGFIASTKGKKYTEAQIIRIIIFNMLRSTMQLEKIDSLMRFVNGEVDDHSDDLLPDIELYNILCAVISEAKKTLTADPSVLRGIISNRLSNFSCDEKEKLGNVLLVMSMAYISSQLKKEMEVEYNKLIQNIELKDEQNTLNHI